MIKPRYFLFFLALLIPFLGIAQDAKYSFQENKGQWNSKVNYRAEVEGAQIFFENQNFHYQIIKLPDHHLHETTEEDLIEGHNFKLEFVGSNPNPIIKSNLESSYYHNYILGNNREKWASEVRNYAEIYYENLYNGIDIKVYQDKGFLKYDYIIDANADINQIELRYKGVKKPKIIDGKILIKHALGELIEEIPLAYQVIKGEKIEVKCAYKFLNKNKIGFDFPNGYESNYPLIIDPLLIFSTYSGSSANNFGMTATYDRLGNAYTAGTVFANGYDTTLGAFQKQFNGGTIDLGISKFSSDGSTLIYSTYLGGSGNESSNSLVVDDSLNLYIFGSTGSSNFPIAKNAYDSTKEQSATIFSGIVTFTNGPDFFITKLNASGTGILGSTFLGGVGNDGVNNAMSVTGYDDLKFNYGDAHRGEIILDSLGNCYIGSCSRGNPIPGALNQSGGFQDGILAKFTSNLDSLIWLRYIGGSKMDAIYSIKIIDSNKVLVGGGTTSFEDFPTSPNSHQPDSGGGRSDGFIAIVSADGQTIEKSTFIGTSDYDQIYFIEFDRFNNVYGFGQTSNKNFPLKNTSVAKPGAGQFFVKLDKNLDSLIMSTTFGDTTNGKTLNISPTAFLVDRCQNIYASGWGGSIVGGEGLKQISDSMYTTTDAFSRTTDGNDFYLYVINRDAANVLYGSFLGGQSSNDHVDGGTSRFDKDGIIYQSVCASCGNNSLSDFPTTPGSYAPVKQMASTGYQCNNAVFKFDFEILPLANFSFDNSDFCIGETDTVAVVITDKSLRANKVTWDFFGTKVLSDFSDTTIFITNPGDFYISQLVEDTVCATGHFKQNKITARPDNIKLQAPIDTIICFSNTYNTVSRHGGNANLFTWSTSNNFTSPIYQGRDSNFVFQLIPGTVKYYIKAENDITDACEKIDSVTIQYVPTSSASSISRDSICEATQISFNASTSNVDHFEWLFSNTDIDSNNLNINRIYNTSGNYVVQFIASNKTCKTHDTTTHNIHVQQNNLNLLVADSIYCGNDDLISTIYSKGSATEYLWSSSNSFSDTLNRFPSDSLFIINSTSSGRYYAKIRSGFCEKIDSNILRYIQYEVNLDPIPELVCSPINLGINSTQVGVSSFEFDFGNGISNTSNISPSINYTDSGTFIIRLITNNQICLRSDTIFDTIRVELGVNLDELNDTLICLGENIQITGNSFGTANLYTWANNLSFINPIKSSTDSILNYFPQQASNIIYLKAERSICSDTSEIIINTQDVDIFLDDYTTICIEDTISLQAFNNNGINVSYNWSHNDSIISGQNSSLILISPKQSYTYTLNTISTIGCVDLDTAFVEVNQPAFADALVIANYDTVYTGQQIQLSSNRNGSNLSYQWEPIDGLSNPTAANPLANPNTTTTYTVTITDNNTGCEVIAFRKIVVFEINCDEPDIFIPSAFSPNNDGVNDVFFVRGIYLDKLEFEIYNRWGELIFKTTNPSVGWDGTYQGRQVDPGVFVYHLTATCFDGQDYFKKGNLTLIR